MTDYRNVGLSEILERAAQHLDLHADILHSSYTDSHGHWRSCPGMRAEHDDKRALSKALRKAAKYAKPNPLGGPAMALYACGDRIRAGEEYHSALRDFGFRVIKRQSSPDEHAPATIDGAQKK